MLRIRLTNVANERSGDAVLPVGDLQPPGEAGLRDPEVPFATCAIDWSHCRATRSRHAGTPWGNGLGTVLILLARPQRHRQGVNRTGDSPHGEYARRGTGEPAGKPADRERGSSAVRWPRRWRNWPRGIRARRLALPERWLTRSSPARGHTTAGGWSPRSDSRRRPPAPGFGSPSLGGGATTCPSCDASARRRSTVAAGQRSRSRISVIRFIRRET